MHLIGTDCELPPQQNAERRASGSQQQQLCSSRKKSLSTFALSSIGLRETIATSFYEQQMQCAQYEQWNRACNAKSTEKL